jgi:hypothetical protein
MTEVFDAIKVMNAISSVARATKIAEKANKELSDAYDALDKAIGGDFNTMEIEPGCLVIIDQHDKPCGDNVAMLMHQKDGLWHGRYIRSRKVCSGSNPTPLSDFGVDIHYDNPEISYFACFGSTAKCSDGEPREWQGAVEEDMFL